MGCRAKALWAFETLWKRRKTFTYWRELEQSQWHSAGELRESQIKALRRLLEHAAANCPYYQEAWQALGLRPATVQSLADFRRWPLIERGLIRANRARMRARSPSFRLIKKSTGGSTGEPLHFDLDVEANDRRMAAWHRGYSWAGAPPGTRQWYLWGGALGNVTRAKRLKDRLYYSLYGRRLVNCFFLTDASVPRYLADLNRFRPRTIVAYTNPLYTFARCLEERGLKPFSPHSIIVGAERLHDFQRELIERVFQAPLFETYGSREFTLIGAECDQHRGLHLTAENLVVEVLDDNGRPTPEGQEGNVVITDLTNYGMPFIRYANGDRAIAGFEDCRCGRGLPLLRQVVGRQLDILRTADGRHIPGEFFPHLFKEFPQIRRYQVVQSDVRTIRVRLMVASGIAQTEIASIKRQITEVVGGATIVEIEMTNHIPLAPSGKLQVVISQLTTPHSH